MCPKRKLTLLALILYSGLSGNASGQCILANPSFEINGSGGPVLGGWNNSGALGKVAEAFHGQQAARVSGPNSGV